MPQLSVRAYPETDAHSRTENQPGLRKLENAETGCGDGSAWRRRQGSFRSARMVNGCWKSWTVNDSHRDLHLAHLGCPAIIPIRQMGTLRLIEEKGLTYGYSARKGQSQDSRLGESCMDSKIWA